MGQDNWLPLGTVAKDPTLHSIDLTIESNQIRTHQKLDRLNQAFVTTCPPLNNGGISVNTQATSPFRGVVLEPINTSQQQAHHSATSKEINQTMAYVSQFAPKHNCCTFTIMAYI